jgi:phosphomannomutase
MTYEDVFNRYDIRGTYPGEIDGEFARRFGKAVGTYAMRNGRGRVVVGRDTREHSKSIHGPFREGVRSTGASLVDVGVKPTDAVGLAAKHYGGIGAMITASHHAWERTGFKLLYEEGYGFSNEDLADIKQLFREEDFDEGRNAPALGMASEWFEEYVEEALAYLDRFGEGEGTIVVDCCNGPTFELAPHLLEKLGFDVVQVNCESKGGGVEPEPAEKNRTAVRERMKDEEAVLAVGYDPDGDRVYIIHPEIGWLGGNEVFYLLGELIEADTIAASVDTSELVEELEAEIDYARVGDVFVSALGAEIDADLLGEPNGHYAVTEFCWYNSGILCSAILALRHTELPELLAAASDYYTERRVIKVDSAAAKDETVQQAMEYAARDHQITSTVDGVKFRGGDFSALIRPSGTSNKVRIIVNGRDRKAVKAAAERIYEELA